MIAKKQSTDGGSMISFTDVLSKNKNLTCEGFSDSPDFDRERKLLLSMENDASAVFEYLKGAELNGTNSGVSMFVLKGLVDAHFGKQIPVGVIIAGALMAGVRVSQKGFCYTNIKKTWFKKQMESMSR